MDASVESTVATTIALITPYLGKFVEEGAKTLGKAGADGGVKLLGWMSSRLVGRAKQALDEAVVEPDTANLANLEKHLIKLLVAEPDLMQEFRERIPAQPDDSHMNQNAGPGAIAVSIRGSGNHVSTGNATSA